jgi:hypothetical protein
MTRHTIARNFPNSGALFKGFEQKESAMLSTVLIIVLILVLIGALPTWGYSGSWGYGPGGVVGLLLIVVLILALTGRI